MTSASVSYSSTSDRVLPPEGPKVVALPFDFTLTPTYDVDLQSIHSRGFISLVQTIYIDNEGNPALTITINQSGQRITAAPGSQGYYTVLVPNPIRFQISCSGGRADTTIFLMNSTVAGHVWGTT
jgi:hypothetical protein